MAQPKRAQRAPSRRGTRRSALKSDAVKIAPEKELAGSMKGDLKLDEEIRVLRSHLAKKLHR